MLKRILELKTGTEPLYAEVILLVQHNAELFIACKGDTARPVVKRMVPADQMPLDQELAIDLRQRGKVIEQDVSVKPISHP